MTTPDLTYRDWRSYAACATAPNPDVFHQDNTSANELIEANATYCTPCPVRAQCLAFAQQIGVRGLFAGTTTGERHGLNRGAELSVLHADLKASRDRQIRELTLKGASAAEVADRLRTTKRTVARVLEASA